MSKFYHIYLLCFSALTACEQPALVEIQEFYISSECSQTVLNTSEFVQDNFNSLGQELFGQNIFRFKGIYEDPDGFTLDDIDDGIRVLYCPDRDNAAVKLHKSLGKVSDYNEEFELGYSGLDVGEDVLFFEYNLADHGYVLSDKCPNGVAEDWDVDYDHDMCKKTTIKYVETMTHELSHSAFGIGDLFVHYCLMSQISLVPVPHFTIVDKGAWCCRYNCTEPEEELCTWDVF